MKNQCTLFTHFIPVISRFFDPVNVTFKLETKRETKKNDIIGTPWLASHLVCKIKIL